MAEPRGIGIRACATGRTGYAFSTDMSEAGVARALAQVKDNLEAGRPRSFRRAA